MHGSLFFRKKSPDISTNYCQMGFLCLNSPLLPNSLLACTLPLFRNLGTAYHASIRNWTVRLRTANRRYKEAKRDYPKLLVPIRSHAFYTAAVRKWVRSIIFICTEREISQLITSHINVCHLFAFSQEPPMWAFSFSLYKG